MGFLNPSRDRKAEGPKSRVGVSLALWKTVALWLLLAGVCLVSALPAQAQSTTSLEYQVKAAFLLNFTKFVEWPSAAFSTFNSPIRICVLGEDPFGPTLNRTLAGEIVNNRSLEAARLSSSGNLRDCHVLFISRSERGRVAQILSGLRGSSVLTVSEVPGFTDAGGMIEFTIDEGKVRFYINAAIAETSGLRLSSRLLRVAMAVRRDNQ